MFESRGLSLLGNEGLVKEDVLCRCPPLSLPSFLSFIHSFAHILHIYKRSNTHSFSCTQAFTQITKYKKKTKIHSEWQKWPLLIIRPSKRSKKKKKKHCADWYVLNAHARLSRTNMRIQMHSHTHRHTITKIFISIISNTFFFHLFNLHFMWVQIFKFYNQRFCFFIIALRFSYKLYICI